VKLLVGFWSLFGIVVDPEHLSHGVVFALWVGTVFAVSVAGVFAIVAVARVFSPAFWRRGDSWLAALNLVFLALAFLGQGGTAWGAAREVGSTVVHGFFPTLAPRAIVTEWLLLCVFWFAFGVLQRMPARALFAPLECLAVSVSACLMWVGYAVCWYEACVHHDVTARLGWGVLVAAIHVVIGYSELVTASGPYVRMMARRGATARPVVPPGWRTRMQDWVDRTPEQPSQGWRWRYSAGELGGHLLRFTLGTSVLVALSILPFALHAARTPTLGAVVHAVLVVYLFSLLAFLFSFSRNAYDIPQVPSVLPRLAQFTTTLAAFVLAVASLAHPGNSLPWPVLMVALAAPLLTALAVFLLRVLPVRAATPRWGTAVGAAAVLAICLLPLHLAVTGFASDVVEGIAHRL
jgi:hypothetical protein